MTGVHVSVHTKTCIHQDSNSCECGHVYPMKKLLFNNLFLLLNPCLCLSWGVIMAFVYEPDVEKTQNKNVYSLHT